MALVEIDHHQNIKNLQFTNVFNDLLNFCGKLWSNHKLIATPYEPQNQNCLLINF